MGKWWPITFKSFSETKFVGHLLSSFEATFRNTNGVIYLCDKNLNSRNNEGRNNIYLKNIIGSADTQFGSRFISDVLGGTVVKISKLAQTDLFPKFLIPKQCDLACEKIDRWIQEFRKLIKKKDYSHVLPSSIQSQFHRAGEISFLSHHAHIDRNMDRYKRGPLSHYKKDRKKRQQLISKVRTTNASYSVLHSTNENNVCGKCKVHWYIFKGNGEWVSCKGCNQWYVKTKHFTRAITSICSTRAKVHKTDEIKQNTSNMM